MTNKTLKKASNKYKRTDVRPSRSISPDVKLYLAIVTAGRCQFQGCNNFLFRHPVNGLSGNFAQYAHIVAFSADGPRGDAPRPRNIHDVSNLMLLCPACHKLVDDRPELYPIKLLREYKERHEKRVFTLTEAHPDNSTTVVKMTARIRGQEVEIHPADIETALFPRFTEKNRDCVIDLSALNEKAPGFYEQARRQIVDHSAALYKPGLDGRPLRHISVFALAPIPLLVHLGAQLSTKIRTEVFQRHRNGEGWTWPEGPATLRYTIGKLRRGNDPQKVALIVSLSGKVRLSDLPKSIGSKHTVYEISVKDKVPSVTLLRHRPDLDGFKDAYQAWLGHLLRAHGGVKIVDLFLAAPAPVAVLCGRERLPKVHPMLRVYENDLSKGGFTPALEVE